MLDLLIDLGGSTTEPMLSFSKSTAFSTFLDWILDLLETLLLGITSAEFLNLFYYLILLSETYSKSFRQLY